MGRLRLIENTIEGFARHLIEFLSNGFAVAGRSPYADEEAVRGA